MNKEELQKTYQTIVLKTNGGIDDYVVALCQIGSAISELDDQQQQIADLQHKLEVAEIALELMRVDYLGMYCSDYCGHGGKCKKCEYEERTSVETYKEQAEKEVKGWKE